MQRARPVKKEENEMLHETRTLQQESWIVASAIFLLASVMAFIILQVSRLGTPLADWLDKIIYLLGLAQ